MARAELFDGTVLDFEEGTPDHVIDKVARQETDRIRTDQARKPLPAGVEPSTAGAGRGLDARPRAEAPPKPRARRGGRPAEAPPFVAYDNQITPEDGRFAGRSGLTYPDDTAPAPPPAEQPDAQFVTPRDIRSSVSVSARAAFAATDPRRVSASPALANPTVLDAPSSDMPLTNTSPAADAEALKAQQAAPRMGTVRAHDPSSVGAALRKADRKPLDDSLGGVVVEAAGDAARGLAKAGPGLAKAAYGAVRAAAEVSGMERVADWAKHSAAAGSDYLAQLDNPNGDKLVTGAFQSLGTAMFGGALGGASGAIALMVGQTGGDKYDELRNQGIPIAAALEGSAVHMVGEYVGERIGMKSLGRLVSGIASKTGFPPSQVLKEALKQQGEEQVTTAIKSLYDKIGSGSVRHGMTWADYLNDVVNTAAQTAIMTAAAAGGARLARVPAKVAQAYAGADASTRYGTAAAAGFNVDPPLTTDAPEVQRKKTDGIFKGLAAQVGIGADAVKRAVEAAAGLPLDKVGAFYRRYADALGKRGLAGAEIAPEIAATLDAGAVEPPDPATAPFSADEQGRLDELTRKALGSRAKTITGPDGVKVKVAAQLAEPLDAEEGIEYRGLLERRKAAASATTAQGGATAAQTPQQQAVDKIGALLGKKQPPKADDARQPDLAEPAAPAPAAAAGGSDQPGGSGGNLGSGAGQPTVAAPGAAAAPPAPSGTPAGPVGDAAGGAAAVAGAPPDAALSDEQIKQKWFQPTSTANAASTYAVHKAKGDTLYGGTHEYAVLRREQERGGVKRVFYHNVGIGHSPAEAWAEAISRVRAGHAPRPLTWEEASLQDLPDASKPNATPTATAPAGGGPRVIAHVGSMPNNATPLELRPNKDGTHTPWLDGREMLDFDSGEPISLPAGATNAQALDAIKAAGALGKHSKLFKVVKDAPGGAAAAPALPDAPTPPAPTDITAPAAAPALTAQGLDDAPKGILDADLGAAGKTWRQVVDLVIAKHKGNVRFDGDFLEYPGQIKGQTNGTRLPPEARAYAEAALRQAPAATAPSVEDIHAVATARGIPFDNDPAFKALTKEVTGKEHLDKLDGPELQAMHDKLSALDPAAYRKAHEAKVVQLRRQVSVIDSLVRCMRG